MKVGVVTTSYPRFPDDPAGNFVGEHVRALRALGHDVEVIAAGDVDREIDRPRDRERDPDRVHDRERDVVRVPSGGLFYTGGAPDLLERSPRRAWAAAMFSARLAGAIARRAVRGDSIVAIVDRARRWDSIVAHWLAPSALACLVAAPRTPLLAIAHGGDVHTLRRWGLLAPTLHLLRAREARLVFVSEELRAIALAEVTRPRGSSGESAVERATGRSGATEQWIANSPVQPMGIDLARFASIPRTPTTPPTIAIASRLVPIKGVDVAIAAFRQLAHRAKLVIAGMGPEMRDLVHAAYGPPGTRAPTISTYTKSELDELERQHGVGFRGAVDTRARDRLLGEASLVLVPSRVIDGRSEGTPLIALEALAAGVPVIASDVGGLRTLDGVVRVRPDDPRVLAAAIDRVLDAPPSANELRARVAHLDWRHVAAALVRSP